MYPWDRGLVTGDNELILCRASIARRACAIYYVRAFNILLESAIFIFI